MDKQNKIQLTELQQFVAYLHEQGYGDIKFLPGNRWAGTFKFIFTAAILTGDIGDRLNYGDRWCYHDLEAAQMALLAWDGIGEPEGWHRHPMTGRRRQGGNNKSETIRM